MNAGGLIYRTALVRAQAARGQGVQIGPRPLAMYVCNARMLYGKFILMLCEEI